MGFFSSHPEEKLKFDQVIRDLNDQTSQLVKLATVADAQAKKADSINDMSKIAASLSLTIKSCDAEATRLGQLVVGEYASFSKAISATKATDLSGTSAALPAHSAPIPKDFESLAWAEEPSAETMTVEQVQELVRNGEEKRSADRALLLAAVRVEPKGSWLPSLLSALSFAVGGAAGAAGTKLFSFYRSNGSNTGTAARV